MNGTPANLEQAVDEAVDDAVDEATAVDDIDDVDDAVDEEVEIKPDATKHESKKPYRRLALKRHPDKDP